MNRLIKCLPALFIFLISHFCVAQCPSVYPEPINQVLASNPQWMVLDVKDLEADDQQLWQQAHAGRCPGLATGNFNGTNISYAVALIKPSDGGGYTEELFLISQGKKKYSHVTVVMPTHVVNPLVVWQLQPGKYESWDKKISVRVPYDSFVYEAMEATATQYYFAHGKLQSLLASD